MESKPRKVLDIIKPQPVLEGAGVRLKRSIATATLDHLDPFLLFDHFGSSNPDDYIKGFPMHPHRGIETVTYMLAGEVRHRDSLGNAGTIGAGDVQWMTAGGGIVHAEMFPLLDADSPNPVQLFQIWLNLPSRDKLVDPYFTMFWGDDIPQRVDTDGEGRAAVLTVIAGETEGLRPPTPPPDSWAAALADSAQSPSSRFCHHVMK